MSSRRNFRRRGGDSDPEDPPNPTPTPQPKPAVKTKKPSLLSFADDEAEEDSPFPKIPPLSKPSSNHKLSSSKHRLPPSKPSNVQPQAGTYTKEALLELQKNTRTLAAPNPKPKPEPTIVLKGLIKPQPNPLIKPDRPDRVVQNDLEEEDGGVIPDQATIDAIRAKRERMRQGRGVGGGGGGGGGGGMGGDYIALDMGSNHGEAEGLSDEEPEMRARIGFLGGEVEEEGGKKGVFEEVEEREKVNSDGEEDEEDRMWEEVQVRKGLGKRIEEAGVGGGSNVAHPTAGAAVYSSLPGVSVSASDGGGTNIGGGVGGLPGVDFMTIGQEAEIAKKALHENLARLRVSDFQPTSV